MFFVVAFIRISSAWCLCSTCICMRVSRSLQLVYLIHSFRQPITEHHIIHTRSTQASHRTETAHTRIHKCCNQHLLSFIKAEMCSPANLSSSSPRRSVTGTLMTLCLLVIAAFVSIPTTRAGDVPRPRGVELSRAALYEPTGNANDAFICLDGLKTIKYEQVGGRHSHTKTRS